MYIWLSIINVEFVRIVRFIYVLLFYQTILLNYITLIKFNYQM